MVQRHDLDVLHLGSSSQVGRREERVQALVACPLGEHLVEAVLHHLALHDLAGPAGRNELHLSVPLLVQRVDLGGCVAAADESERHDHQGEEDADTVHGDPSFQPEPE